MQQVHLQHRNTISGQGGRTMLCAFAEASSEVWFIQAQNTPVSAGMPNSATGLGGRSDSRSGTVALALGVSTLAMLKLSVWRTVRSGCRACREQNHSMPYTYRCTYTDAQSGDSTCSHDDEWQALRSLSGGGQVQEPQQSISSMQRLCQCAVTMLWKCCRSVSSST